MAGSPVSADRDSRLPAFASFGAGSHIAEPHIVAGAEYISIGAGVAIGPRAWLSVVDEYAGVTYAPRLEIGDGTALGADIVIACIGHVQIGRHVLTAPRVFIGDTYHDFRRADMAIIDQPMTPPRPVQIGDGAFLGIGSIVLPGVSVGERAYVAAGAVVTKAVPPNAVVAGNPARVIKRWDPRLRRWRTPLLRRRPSWRNVSGR